MCCVLLNIRFFIPFLSSIKVHILPEIHSFLFLVEYPSTSFPVSTYMLLTLCHISSTPTPVASSWASISAKTSNLFCSLKLNSLWTGGSFSLSRSNFLLANSLTTLLNFRRSLLTTNMWSLPISAPLNTLVSKRDVLHLLLIVMWSI